MKARSRIQNMKPKQELVTQWLTTGDCAKRLGVTARMIARWIDNGRLLGLTLPGSKDRRVHPEALAEFEEREGFNRARGTTRNNLSR